MHRDGFTLIELLLAMVIMAILTALAVRVSTSKSAAALAVMKSDLRNLASAQEAYFSGHGTYADNAEDVSFEGSQNVTIRLRGSATGWSGRTEHQLKADFQCALFIGDGVAPFTPATEEGIMQCEPSAGGGCFGG